MTYSYLQAAIDRAIKHAAADQFKWALKQLPRCSAMYEYTGVMPAAVTCPTCKGAGWTEVGLIGFGLSWHSDCPDCDGIGTVTFVKANKIKDIQASRVHKGLPTAPPPGGYNA